MDSKIYMKRKIDVHEDSKELMDVVMFMNYDVLYV